MSSNRNLICDVSRQSVCMGDDVDGMHEMSVVIDCAGVDNIALHCSHEITKRNYIPSVANGSTWIAEADGRPFAVVEQDDDVTITTTRAERDVLVTGDRFTLFFSYYRRRDAAELLAEINAGRRPRR